jgi:hypothetical protein
LYLCCRQVLGRSDMATTFSMLHYLYQGDHSPHRHHLGVCVNSFSSVLTAAIIHSRLQAKPSRANRVTTALRMLMWYTNLRCALCLRSCVSSDARASWRCQWALLFRCAVSFNELSLIRSTATICSAGSVCRSTQLLSFRAAHPPAPVCCAFLRRLYAV